jgi:hypothetical protein
VSIEPALIPCMPVVGRSEGFRKPKSQPSASVTGSEVFPGRLLENRIVQSQIRHQPLEPPVLLLQLLEPSGLLHPYPSVFPPSSVVGLLRDAELAAHFRHRTPLTEQYLCLPQLPNDLLCSIPLLFRPYLSILISGPYSNSSSGPVFGGQGN